MRRPPRSDSRKQTIRLENQRLKERKLRFSVTGDRASDIALAGLVIGTVASQLRKDDPGSDANPPSIAGGVVSVAATSGLKHEIPDPAFTHALSQKDLYPGDVSLAVPNLIANVQWSAQVSSAEQSTRQSPIPIEGTDSTTEENTAENNTTSTLTSMPSSSGVTSQVTPLEERPIINSEGPATAPDEDQETQPTQVADSAIEDDDLWYGLILPGFSMGGTVGTVAVAASELAITTSSSGSYSAGGAVIDDYVYGAMVFLDIDGDAEWDVGEAYAYTDIEGGYTLSYTADQAGALVSTGGVDTSSGVTMGTLQAPSGYSVITPLTTLVAAGADISSLLPDGFSLAELKTFDPQSSLTGSNASFAASLMATGQQLLAVITASTALAEAAGVSSTVARANILAALSSASSAGTLASAMDDPTAVLTASLIDSGLDSSIISAGASALASAMSFITPEGALDGSNAVLAKLTQDTFASELTTLAQASDSDLVATLIRAMASKYEDDTNLKSAIVSENASLSEGLATALSQAAAVITAAASAASAASSGLTLNNDSLTALPNTNLISYDVLANDVTTSLGHPVLVRARQALDSFEVVKLTLPKELLVTGNSYQITFDGYTLNTGNLVASSADSLLTTKQIAAAFRTQSEINGQHKFIIVASDDATLKFIATSVGDMPDASFKVTDSTGTEHLGTTLTISQGVNDTSINAEAYIQDGLVKITGPKSGTVAFVYTAIDSENPDVIGDANFSVYYPSPVSTLTFGSLAEDTDHYTLAAGIENFSQKVKTTFSNEADTKFFGISLLMPDTWEVRFSNDAGLVIEEVDGRNVWRISPEMPSNLSFSESIDAIKFALSGLTVRSPENFSGSNLIEITAYSAFDVIPAKHSKELTIQLPITITAVADTPLLTLTAASGLEDQWTTLQIAAKSSDAGEMVGVTIRAIPEGAQLRNAAGPLMVVDGMVSLDASGLTGLEILAPANYAGSFTLAVRAETRDGSSTNQSTTQVLSLLIQPVSEEPRTILDGAQLLDVPSHVIDIGNTRNEKDLVNFSVPFKIAGISSSDPSEHLVINFSGESIAQGTSIRLTHLDGTHSLYSYIDGKITIDDIDNLGIIQQFNGELLLPSGVSYGVHSINLEIESHDGISVPGKIFTNEFFKVTGLPTPTPMVGITIQPHLLEQVDIVIDDKTVAAYLVQLSDLIRVSQFTRGQYLEISDINSDIQFIDEHGIKFKLSEEGSLDIGAQEFVNSKILVYGDGLIKFNARTHAQSSNYDEINGSDSNSTFTSFSVYLNQSNQGTIENDWAIAGNQQSIDMGSGDDLLQLSDMRSQNIVQGGEGFDTLSFNQIKNPVTVDLNFGIAISVDSDSNITPKILEIDGFEGFVGSEFADTFFGSGVSRTEMILRGAGGNDWLVGSSGNDVIDGGTGSDYLEGGEGSDTFVLTPGSGSDRIGDFDLTEDHIMIAGFKLDQEIDASDLISIERIQEAANWYWQIRVDNGKNTAADFILENESRAITEADISAEKSAITTAIILREFVDIETINIKQLHKIDNTEISNPENLEIQGTNNDDLGTNALYATNDGSSIFGGNGEDEIIGGTSADILLGGFGTDRLIGNQGADSFIFDRNIEVSGLTEKNTVLAYVEDFDRQEGDQIILLNFLSTPTVGDVIEIGTVKTTDYHASQAVEVDGYSVIFNLTTQRNLETDFQIRQTDLLKL